MLLPYFLSFLVSTVFLKVLFPEFEYYAFWVVWSWFL